MEILRRRLKNQAVLAEAAARKLFAARPEDWPKPTTDVELREQVEKVIELGVVKLTNAEAKALQRMSTLHRWEQKAQEQQALEAEAHQRNIQAAAANGLDLEEYLCMVHLMTAKAQNDLTDKGMEALQGLLDKSDAFLKAADDAAAADIAAMRAELVRGG